MGKQVMKLLGLCLIAVLAAIVVLDAGCVFYKVTGIPCPGCGSTRAYLAAAGLRFGEAFKMHPLWPVTAPLLAVSVWKEGNLFRSRKANTLFYALMAALYIGVYIARMVTLFPDTPPMVFNENALLPALARQLGLLI